MADSGPTVVLDDALLATGLIELRSGVREMLQSGSHTLVVDISGLDRMSSSTVAALFWAQRRCRVAGGSVRLRGVTRRSQRRLRRTGLWRVFEIEPVAGGGRAGRVTW
jgi:anti-anti-sigma factor